MTFLTVEDSFDFRRFGACICRQWSGSHSEVVSEVIGSAILGAASFDLRVALVLEVLVGVS